MVLAPLGPEQAERFLDQLAVDLPHYARVGVLEQAAGNPLALAELSRCALENTWAPDAPLPLTQRLVAIFGDRLKNSTSRSRRNCCAAHWMGPRRVAWHRRRRERGM